MSDKISVYIAPGEAGRETAMRKALAGDNRFLPLKISSDIPVDLQFSTTCPAGWTNAMFNIELKMPHDFVGSVLNGHLMDQTLSIRESGYNGCTVILGSMDEMYAAIKDSAKLRKGKYLKGDESRKAIAETHLRCKSFRKRSMLNGVPVFHKGDDSGFFDSDDQFKDILELAHDYLQDGDMMGFRQRPAEREREACALSMLLKNFGPALSNVVLDQYRVGLFPRGEYAVPIEELPGIGKKRAAQISPLIRMVYANRVKA